LLACGSSGGGETPPPTPPPTAAADAAPARKLFVNNAVRCSECHEKMQLEWRDSAHARTATSAFYLAARRDAGDPTCDRCHAPLAALGVEAATAAEGVTCDVCHTMREARPDPAGGKFRIAVDDMVRYSARCGLEDHYFHRMGCSPEHAEAEHCAACHDWKRGDVPVLTEFTDWQAGPAGQEGRVCQSCHMPAVDAAIANGGEVRGGVRDHGMLGRAGDLRGKALTGVVEASVVADSLVVTVRLRNKAGSE
jgi:hypothetical protein